MVINYHRSEKFDLSVDRFGKRVVSVKEIGTDLLDVEELDRLAILFVFNAIIGWKSDLIEAYGL